MSSEARSRVVVLAGGRGRRLRPISTVIPKPLIPVGEVPILEVLLRLLAAQGFRDVILSLGYLGELVRAFVAAREERFRDLRLSFVQEETPLGTAGALSLLPPGSGAVGVLNGDILTDLDFAAMRRFHDEGGAALTVAVCRRPFTIPFGVVETDGESHAVVAYREKPETEAAVSMGAYWLSAATLERLRPGEHRDMPNLVCELIAAGERVLAFPWNGTWADVGTPGTAEDAERLASRLLEKAAQPSSRA